MDEELLNSYWQKGGTYVIPVEVMNDFYEDYKEQKIKAENNQKAVGYIVRELIEINKHQYAGGSRRLKKVLAILQSKEGASNCE